MRCAGRGGRVPGWAFVDPPRKLGHDLTITGAVVSALFIGGIETLDLRSAVSSLNHSLARI